jgi:hypothetical protein
LRSRVSRSIAYGMRNGGAMLARVRVARGIAP